MDSNQLKEWVIKHNVSQRTIECFWQCLNNYRKDEPKEFHEWFGDFDENQIKIWFEQVALKVRNWDNFENIHNGNHEFIDALIVIEHKGENTAEYTLRLNYEGEVIDDFFGTY